MSKPDEALDEAREAIEVGNLKRALNRAWAAGTDAARNESQSRLRETIGVAEAIAERGEGKVHKEAELLRRYCATCLADYEAGIERRTPLSALFGRRPKQKLKQCPQCAEKVLAAAKVCRFCGHQFGEPAES